MAKAQTLDTFSDAWFQRWLDSNVEITDSIPGAEHDDDGWFISDQRTLFDFISVYGENTSMRPPRRRS